MNVATPFKKATTSALVALLLAPMLGLAGVRADSLSRATAPPVFSKDDDHGNKKLAPDLEDAINSGVAKGKGNQVTQLIVQLSDKKASGLSDSDVEGKLAHVGGKLKNRFDSMGLFSADVPLLRIAELQNDDDIAYVSPDRPVQSFGHIETAITAAQEDGRSEVSGFTSLNGTGVGIAVLDSGIDDTHNLIKASTGRPVIYSKTWTGIAANRDYYGHGTHVASMLMGNPGFKSNYYGGIAYESKIISLGVLNGSGSGSASNVIAAIDWCIANKATYNIRIINMSLGAPAKDSYKTDPLCLAARRAYNAGIVVVVAAGNRGKKLIGPKGLWRDRFPGHRAVGHYCRSYKHTRH